MKRVCVLPGDGIGPEVISSAVMVLEHVTNDLQFEYSDIGRAAMAKRGSYLPAETLDLMRASDSCLFGAVTSTEDPGYQSPVLAFRRALDLYANLRPVRRLVQSQSWKPIDLVIVRENSEGMYNQEEVKRGDSVITMRKVSRSACERIVRFSLDYARTNNRKRICCVHKSNVLRSSDGLFVGIFREVMAQEGGDIAAEEQLVDSAAMSLVTNPGKFDVIVTLNLYGDILSDVAAGVAGGLGFAPSGNIGPHHSVFEPAHGSAPDIAGKGVANPTAAILSGVMMLKHLGMSDEAQRAERAVADVYRNGHLTVDIGGRHGSESFTKHVLERLQ